MDINQINECMVLSLVGKITLSEIAIRLSAAGVERYIVDLVTFHRVTYGNDGEYYRTPFSFSDIPEIPKIFDLSALKNTITNIRQYKIDYPAYLRGIMASGSCNYEVYLHTKKIVYFGRDGSYYIEDFSWLK
ncbi:MAG: hypothetical protein K2Q34_02800 [Alphaproteobacteria bacterium]|nr:hypothetical protein [Alphaproteobacteria bacterium]